MAIITGKDIYQDDGTLEKLKDNLRFISEEAKKLKGDLQTVNNTNQKGREKVNELNSEIERLLQLYKDQKIKVDELESALEKEIQATINDKTAKQALNQINRETNNIAKLQYQLNSAAEGSYNKLSAQYSLNKIALNKLSKEQRSNTEEGKKLEKETKAIYEEMKRLQEATGKHVLDVGNYKKALEDLPGPLGRVAGGAGQVGSMFLRLVKNPVVATLALVAGLFTTLAASMKRSEDGQDRLNKVLIVGKTAWDNILDVVLSFGIALYDTLPKFIKRVSNDFKTFGLDIEGAFLKARIAWNKFTGDKTEAATLTKDLEDIKKKTIDLKEESERLGNETVEAFKKPTGLVKNLGDEMEKEIAKAKKLADLEAQLNRTERKYLVENAKLSKESAKLRAEAEEDKLVNADEGLKKLQQAFDLDETILKNEIALEKTRVRILKEKSDLAEDTIAEKKEIAQGEANIFNLETQYDEKRRERIRTENKFRKQAFQQENDRRKLELETIKDNNDIEIRELQRIIDMQNASQDQKMQAAELIQSIRAKQLEEGFNIEIATLEKEKELKLISDVDYASKKLSIETKLKNEIAKISEETTATYKAITEDTYDNELDLFNKRQEILTAEFNSKTHTEQEKSKYELQTQLDTLKKELELRIKYGQFINQEELDLLRARIKQINFELGNVGLDDKNDKDIFDLLGINLKDEQKEAIKTAFDEAKQFLSDYLQKQKEIADELVSLRQKETDQTLEKLRIEREAQAAGYHNNVAQAEKEYKLAEKRQKDAIALQKKAQKEQILVNAALQASNMVLATSKIWSAYSSTPYIAIPLIALMWGSFIASQVKALSLTKKYKRGGFEIIKGGSHYIGNDTFIGENNGVKNYAESGEGFAVYNRNAMSKFGKQIQREVEMYNNGQNPLTRILNEIQMPKQSRNQNIIVKGEKKKDLFLVPADGKEYAIIDEKGKIINSITVI